MATLKTIRKRITSVRNTQKITKAMKMVAAAKLRRAQQAVTTVRPFADRLQETMASIVSKNDRGLHPFFGKENAPKKGAFFIFTSNRGLCGGFNSNLLRRIDTFLKGASSRYEQIDLFVIGKKGRDYFRARKRELKEVYLEYADNLSFEEANQLAVKMLAGFLEGEYDEYYLVYNHFKSALSQEVRIEKVIPFSLEGTKSSVPEKSASAPLTLLDYIYEPSQKEVVEAMIPKYIASELYRAHKESIASELGARMSAMENATNNAKEMIRLLTLQYNRLRQAAITRELMDIVNGAEAIK